jgi:hypothetical protein
MNKLFTKIASAFVGIAMAVGVGVALGVDRKAEPVKADEVTLAYSGSTTTNMDGKNQAALLGLSAADWSVVGDKGGASNNVGLNKAGDLRLYYSDAGSNTLTVSSLKSWTINSIVITYTGSGYANGKVLVGSSVVTDTDSSATTSTHAINSTSFVVTNGNTSNTQVRITSILIDYTNGGGEQTLYTVTLNANLDDYTEDVPSVTQSSEGAAVTIPSLTLEGYDFDGWNTEADGSGTGVAAGSYTPTDNITLFGQWSKSSEETGSWEKTELADLTADDVFVIVGNNGSNYAMANDNGTSAAPAAVAVTVESDEITSKVVDKIKWNVAGNASDGYTFYPNGSTTTWLYCTNTNNGVRVGTNENKAFTISEAGYLLHTATKRYVGVYNSADWRCYTSINDNIKGQTFAFYKYNDGDVPQPKITLDPATLSLTTSSEEQTVTVTPNGAFEGTPTITLENVPSFVNASVDGLSVKVSPKSAGTASVITVKATSGEQVATADLTVSVADNHGRSADDPLSVAEARAVIDGTYSIDATVTYYVVGLYESTPTAWSDQHKNVTYNVVDKDDTTQKFQYYRMSADADPKCGDGDLIIVSCLGSKFTKYGSTYECQTPAYVSHSTQDIPLEELRLSADLTQIKVGDTLSLSLEYVPSTTTHKDVTYESSNDEIAEVSETGVVSANASGEVVITVKSNDYEAITDTYEITVLDPAIEGDYLIKYDTSKSIAYNTSMTLTDFPSYTTGFNADVFSLISVSAVYANNTPKTSYFSFGGHSTTGGSLGMTLNDTGYVITKVVLTKALSIGSETPSVEVGDISYDPVNTETNYSFYPYNSQFSIETVGRLFFESIIVTVAKDDSSAALAESYEAAFIDLTSKACEAKNVTESDWTRVKQAFTNLNSYDSNAAELVKAAPESVDAIARYKVIIERYGYEDFLNKGYEKVTKTGYDITKDTVSSSSAIVIVTIIAITSVTAIGALLVIKRRKSITK